LNEIINRTETNREVYKDGNTILSSDFKENHMNVILDLKLNLVVDIYYPDVKD